MPRWPGFVGGSSVQQSVIADAQRTVNLYVEHAQSPAAQNQSALYPTPGFQAWSQAGVVTDVGTRGFGVAGSRIFAGIGGGFYEFDINGVPTKRGTLAVDVNPVTIVYNGIGGQLAIAAGGNLYCYVLATNVLTQVLTGIATMVAYAGGYGFAFDVNTGKTRVSTLNDLSVWDAGTFFQRSFFADPAQAIFVDANNLVWTLGTDSFEVRYNSGVGTQPWVPLSGLVGLYGIAAPFAFGRSGLGNFWLARSPDGIGQFVVTRGSSPQPVNSYAFSTAVAGYLRNSQISDAEVFSYHQDGHSFAVPSFPSAPAGGAFTATWAYDIEGDSWAERGKWNAPLGRFDLWAPRCHVYAYGKHLIGDRASGTIWQMDTSFATDTDGKGIRRLRRATHLNAEHARLPLDSLELLMDVGLGLQTGQGSDPTVMLRISQDGGRTWGNERRGSGGKVGNYKQRVYWSRLGTSPLGDVVAEVSYSDPTPLRIIDAYVNNKEGQAAA